MLESRFEGLAREAGIACKARADAGAGITDAAIRAVDLAEVTRVADAPATARCDIGTVGFIENRRGIVSARTVSLRTVGAEPFGFLRFASPEANLPARITEAANSERRLPLAIAHAGVGGRMPVFRERQGVRSGGELGHGDALAVSGTSVRAGASLARPAFPRLETTAFAGESVAEAIVRAFAQRMCGIISWQFSGRDADWT